MGAVGFLPTARDLPWGSPREWSFHHVFLRDWKPGSARCVALQDLHENESMEIDVILRHARTAITGTSLDWFAFGPFEPLIGGVLTRFRLGRRRPRQQKCRRGGAYSRIGRMTTPSKPGCEAPKRLGATPREGARDLKNGRSKLSRVQWSGLPACRKQKKTRINPDIGAREKRVFSRER